MSFFADPIRISSRVFDAKLEKGRCIIFLEALTLAYLGLPLFLWLFGWLRLWIALPLALGLLFSLVYAWKETRRHFDSGDFSETGLKLPLLPFLGALFVALAWGVYSGAGGITYTSPDWAKHYAMMRDLTEGAWPVTYSINQDVSPLVFYLSYYLPSAAVAKVFGWWYGCVALNIWTCLGTMLAISWFVLLAGRRPVLAALLFIFANGLDFIGERIVQGGALPSGMEHLDWWAGIINLPGHYSQLVWAPQHSLAAWIITGLLAVQLPRGRGVSHALLLVALAAFWSPFSIIGIIPLAVAALMLSDRRGIFSIPNLFAILLLALALLFYCSRREPSQHGFLWDLNDLRLEWPRLLLAHVMEWGLFFLFAGELRRSENPWLRVFFWTAGASLLLYPFYSYGTSNDWVMRTTIPAMFLLWAGVIRSLLAPRPGLETRLLLVLFVFGAFGSLHESARTWHLPVSPQADRKLYFHVPQLDESFSRQYLGSPGSFFFLHLARPSSPLEVEISGEPHP